VRATVNTTGNTTTASATNGASATLKRSKRKYQATPEQIAAAKVRRAKMREIAQKISKMTDVERTALVSDWPTTIEGRQLSMHNACMIAYQGGATVVGGFWQWKAAGRKVKKGGTGLAIWAPAGERKGESVEEIETGEANADGSKKRMRFLLVTVFDISQTEEASATSAPAAPACTCADDFSNEPCKAHESKPIGRVNVLELAAA
jgi:hypothetical protein